MNLSLRRRLLSATTLLASALFTLTGNASPLVFNNLSTTNVTSFYNGSTLHHQWTSGTLALPTDTLLGPNSTIELSLSLSGKVTTAATGEYGAGIKLINTVDPDSEIFGFTYQLTQNGVNVGSPIGYDLMNPFSFAVDNVGTGSLSDTVKNLTFDGINVTIYNHTSENTVKTFQTYLDIATSVPDSGSTTLVLLGVTLIGLAGAAHKKRKV